MYPEPRTAVILAIVMPPGLIILINAYATLVIVVGKSDGIPCKYA
jgi:hypothetical protein